MVEHAEQGVDEVGVGGDAALELDLQQCSGCGAEGGGEPVHVLMVGLGDTREATTASLLAARLP